VSRALAALLLVLLLLLAVPAYASAAGAEAQAPRLDVSKLSPLLRAVLCEGKPVGGAAIYGDYVRGKVIVGSEDVWEALRYVKAYMALPVGGSYILFGYYRLSDLPMITSIPGVALVHVDIRPSFWPQPDAT